MYEPVVFETLNIRQLRTEVSEIAETSEESPTTVPLTDLRVFPRQSREKVSPGGAWQTLPD